jgi:hypothetical protein
MKDMVNDKSEIKIVHGPKISVQYIYGVAYKPKRYRSKRDRSFWISGLVLLLLGISLGGTSVWYSQFGKANLEAQQAPETLAVAGTIEAPQLDSIPLEFDNSELEVVTTMLPILIEENHHEPSAEELRNLDRKKKLTAYFKDRKSPFGDDEKTVEAFLNSRNMKVMIAISFVESTMGKNCYYYNCSGIGGYPPNLRKYDGFSDWVRDFDDLLERRYKGVSIDDFMGLYVQPGSPNWISGVKQILAELNEQGIE